MSSREEHSSCSWKRNVAMGILGAVAAYGFYALNKENNIFENEQRSHHGPHTPLRRAESDNDCPICWERLKSHKVSSLSCSHNFHVSCIMDWIKISDTCPLCRMTIPLGDVFRLNVSSVF